MSMPLDNGSPIKMDTLSWLGQPPYYMPSGKATAGITTGAPDTCSARTRQQKGITDDKDIVTTVTRYTSLKVKDLIKTLESYKIPSWKDLRADLLQYYNTDQSTQQYTLSDLMMFQVWSAKQPIRSLDKWHRYTQKFQHVTGWLLEHSMITENGMHMKLHAHIIINLKVNDPKHNYCTPFSVDKVTTAVETYLQRNHFDAEHLLSDQETADSLDDSSNEDDSSSSEDDVVHKPVMMGATVTVMTMPVPVMDVHTAMGSINRGCFGCGNPGHGVRDCPEVLQLLSDGIVTRDMSGQIIMKDGGHVACMSAVEGLITHSRTAAPSQEAPPVWDPPPHEPLLTQPIEVLPLRVTVDPNNSDAFMEDDTHNLDEITTKPRVSADSLKGLEATGKRVPRRIELQAQIDQADILDRVLGTSVSLKIGKVLAISKDMSHQLQNVLKLRQAAMVALTVVTPSRGTLIKLQMECDDRPVTAIIDTGSQLNIAHWRVWKSMLRRPMDVTCFVNMNDVNGGWDSTYLLFKDHNLNVRHKILVTPGRHDQGWHFDPDAFSAKLTHSPAATASTYYLQTEGEDISLKPGGQTGVAALTDLSSVIEEVT
ncbi:predicted protein [Postia placenta Mad-698-R]|uniref:CCHC-type domain-containing protein n=1 Tax=Postia placenta MAD-698-R-SB12 TaxID=670580 RepID=A0A1X6N2A5_9APHY|nr:hypothetical protein POSPLADRAFT_1046060 [Postia placenta MAD-698-R-SB12]EED82415.1 predicted protein [Postia placenta Mad-698-R]OSX62612.1 hypothetical protein POSPLADRAFT_1046060 [Postia placenta MAD-698-R-SB12]